MAALVDGIIMSVPFIALLFVSAGLAGIGLAEIRQVAQGNATYFLPLMFVFFIATNVAVTVYHVYFWTTSGATPGKSLLGLRVVSRDLSRRVNMWEALLRFFGYWAMSPSFGTATSKPGTIESPEHTSLSSDLVSSVCSIVKASLRQC